MFWACNVSVAVFPPGSGAAWEKGPGQSDAVWVHEESTPARVLKVASASVALPLGATPIVEAAVPVDGAIKFSAVAAAVCRLKAGPANDVPFKNCAKA